MNPKVTPNPLVNPRALNRDLKTLKPRNSLKPSFAKRLDPESDAALRKCISVTLRYCPEAQAVGELKPWYAQ